MPNVQPQFPSSELPREASAQRLVGLYPQRQPGLFMQRVKVLGGRLAAEQWSALGRLAARYGAGGHGTHRPASRCDALSKGMAQRHESKEQGFLRERRWFDCSLSRSAGRSSSAV